MTSETRSPTASSSSPHSLNYGISRVSSPDQLARQQLAQYRGGPSPTPSNGSSKRPSKRDIIRSRNPAPVHVSKLEPIGGSKQKSHKSTAKSSKPSSTPEAEDVEIVTTDIGILADAVYDEYLDPPVAWLRRILVRSLHWESPLLARHQLAVRHPFLDRYFVYTSLFGTHSFFLIFLPATFWLGDEAFARGLVNALAFGVYVSSAIKDLLCIPRPYSPPVTRLTIGSVHLEYGFLSTHSTNSVGMAWYIYLWILKFRTEHAADASYSVFDSKLWEAGLLIYSLSVVYGRVYAGMHSVMDCLCGSLLGIAVTMTQWLLFDKIEAYLEIAGWFVPLTLVPICLLMVYAHPEPLDDCPCFEDAIAFISVVQGVCLGRWASIRWPSLLSLDQSASPFAPASGQQVTVVRYAIHIWAVIAGVTCVFLLRILVKTGCRLLLPSIFRFADRTFGLVLPRRHYVPSSEYDEVPLGNILRSPSFSDLPTSFTPQATPAGDYSSRQLGETSELNRRFGHGLDASTASSSIHSRLSSSETQSSLGAPSQLTLRHPFASNTSRDGNASLSAQGATSDDEFISRPSSPSSWSESSGTEITAAAPTQRPAKIQFDPSPCSSLSVPFTHPRSQGGESLPSDQVADDLAATLSSSEAKRQATLVDPDSEVKHYDIDVLTKVCVYTGIGFVSASAIPAWLSYMGWTR